MSPKALLKVGLLAFVAASVGFLVLNEARAPEQATTSATGDADGARQTIDPGSQPTHRVIAYYLHNTQRCRTCLKIERLSAEALSAEFPDALARGELEWHAVDMEESPNAHFVTDYELVTSSLVIVDLRDGEQRAWTVMDRVWELVHEDETAFRAYVADQVRAYLES